MSTTAATIPAVVTAAIDEVERARRLFPRPDHLVLALAEEAGEVVKAALDIRNKKQGATTVELRREIVQTMAMCIRLAEEGDPTIGVYGLRLPEADLAVLIRQEEIAAAVFMNAAQPLSDIHFVGSPYFARPRFSSDPVDVGLLVAENARLKAALATERGYAAEAWDILARGGVRCRALSTQAAGTISYVESLEAQIAALRGQIESLTRERDERNAATARSASGLRIAELETQVANLLGKEGRDYLTKVEAERDQLKAELAAEKERADYWETESQKRQMSEVAARAEADALRKDASRWRGLIASQRIRPLGCAGLRDDKENDMYAYIGLDIWTVYPGSHDNRIGIDWLTKYADKAACAAGIEVES